MLGPTIVTAAVLRSVDLLRFFDVIYITTQGGPGYASSTLNIYAYRKGFEFSFSGLKTAVSVHIEQHGQPSSRAALADLCASFQAAVVEVLVAKARLARRKFGCPAMTIVGGVSANHGLREAMAAAARADGFELWTPALRYCGDNAAMIAAAAALRAEAGMAPKLRVFSSGAIDEART